MPSEKALLALIDIRENIALAKAFIGEMDFDEFRVDRKTFYAVSRCLEIVSEASRRLPVEMQHRHPHLPWRAIMGLGNVYRHEYDNIAEEVVWRTVAGSLQILLDVIDSEIRAVQDG